MKVKTANTIATVVTSGPWDSAMMSVGGAIKQKQEEGER